jgi:hypothetical protein
MSHEIANRTALKSLIASLTSWQTWTGLDAAGAAARIGWPTYPAENFPYILLVTLAGGRTNVLGSDSSANFRSRGGIGVIVVDFAADESDLAASDTAFATEFFGLMDDLVEHAHDTELMIEKITYGDNPYQISSVNTSHPQSADEDGVDDETGIEKLFFQGVFEVTTGVA